MGKTILKVLIKQGESLLKSDINGIEVRIYRARRK